MALYDPNEIFIVNFYVDVEYNTISCDYSFEEIISMAKNHVLTFKLGYDECINASTNYDITREDMSVIFFFRADGASDNSVWCTLCHCTKDSNKWTMQNICLIDFSSN